MVKTWGYFQAAIIAVCFLFLVSSISDAQTEADVYEQAAPAVVSIQTFAGAGSGFVIGADYHIVTNAHVMGEWTTARVSFFGGEESQAQLVGIDHDADIAILEVDDLDRTSASRLAWGYSDALRIGEPVLAIGAPRGLEWSLTRGIISGLDRVLPSLGLTGLIQTDAEIAPGSSGGPLLDMNGAVIGVNVAGHATDVLNFAVPSNEAAQLVTQMLLTPSAPAPDPAPILEPGRLNTMYVEIGGPTVGTAGCYVEHTTWTLYSQKHNLSLKEGEWTLVSPYAVREFESMSVIPPDLEIEGSLFGQGATENYRLKPGLYVITLSFGKDQFGWRGSFAIEVMPEKRHTVIYTCGDE